MSTPKNTSKQDFLCINTIRTLSIDAIEKAKSGHPGLPLGAAPMAYVLWQYHLKHNPKDPHWPDRDRFVLSAGHGSMLLYSMLHLTGYDLSLDDIKNFRQWDSKTPGHPEYGLTPGVEATTGPLGQGSANAVGMAIAERRLAALFNQPDIELVNHFTYALVSDGDMMEGISAEAASLAGHLKLGKLIYLYDANDISLDGPTSLTFSTEDVAKRYEAYGWQVLHIREGNTDLEGLHQAIQQAKADTSRPTLIIVKTTIGYGAPNKQGTSGVHGAPLGADELEETKKALGWDPKAQFLIPKEAKDHFLEGQKRGEKEHTDWESKFSHYREKHPDLAKLWDQAQKGEIPKDLAESLPSFSKEDSIATRKASGQTLNAIAKKIPWFFGGDADLSCSTNTAIKDDETFNGQTGKGRNIHYGVREHAMGAIANGIAYHGGLRSYTATFFCFSDYMRPAVRLAALNHLPVLYVWTHDSIGLGEDGPTHQPVEHLMSLRCMPNLTMIRPADANETKEAWQVAMEIKDGPVGLVLTRQNLPTLDRDAFFQDHPGENPVQKGAYVLHKPSKTAKAVIIATGSEVQIALEAAQTLEKENLPVQVVSMPSFELFEKQPLKYKETVLPSGIEARVAVEAGCTLGWERWVGEKGIIIGLDRFGASAPGKVNFEKFEFTPKSIADNVKSLLKSL